MTEQSNPQIEDGYTMIANELLEAIIRFDFSKRALKIVLFVIRKTYGYNKKSDDLSLSQICNATGIAVSHASEAVNDLCAMQVLLKREGRFSQNIAINKKYGEWKGLPKREPVTKSGIEGLLKQELSIPETVTTKETTKYNSKRNGSPSGKSKSSSITLRNFIDDCKASGNKTIPDDDPIFEYASKVGIDHEMIAVCWQEFKAAYLQSQKCYQDWRATFRNAVRRDWYRLWYLKEGEMARWTSGGEQARRAAA